jgi:hypothetical protein
MTQTWRDVATELAGPRAVLKERPAPSDWHGDVVAEVELSKPIPFLPLLPGDSFMAGGEDSDVAWMRIAHDLADYRLKEALQAAGWNAIEEVVDETTYVVARDPKGTLWAIGIASSDSDRQGYIERDIEFDERTFGRIAVIEPIDARDPAAVFAALGAKG